MAQSAFGKKRFPKEYQTKVGINARPMLHDNSKELVSILKQNSIPVSGFKVFELGSGGARNLHYILKEFPGVKLYCSDLFEESSKTQMSQEVLNEITFYEGDSEDIVNANPIKDLDLLLVSDHFMHLQYKKADNIIKTIIKDWQPKYIMLREIKKEFETPNHPRLFHNYKQFLDNYFLKSNTSSKQDNCYFIWLLQKK